MTKKSLLDAKHFMTIVGSYFPPQTLSPKIWEHATKEGNTLLVIWEGQEHELRLTCIEPTDGTPPFIELALDRWDRRNVARIVCDRDFDEWTFSYGHRRTPGAETYARRVTVGKVTFDIVTPLIAHMARTTITGKLP